MTTEQITTEWQGHNPLTKKSFIAKSGENLKAFTNPLLKHKGGVVGLSVVGLIVFVAIFAPLLAPFDPFAQNPADSFIPPIWQQGGRWPILFGTDILGRDLLSRIIYGARISLVIGSVSVFVGATFGIPLGLFSGYFGGRVDLLIMRITDIMLAFPSLLLAVCIVAILGPSLENAMIAVGVVNIPQFARLTRASVLGERQKEYVLADLAMGRSHTKIIFRGILPNILSPIFVLVTLNFAGAVLEAAGLSFLGLGAQPPVPEWGALLAEGKQYIYQAWWLVIFPGLAILMSVLGFNLLGDAVRDVLDPKV